MNAFFSWRRDYLKRLGAGAGAEPSGAASDASTEWARTDAAPAHVSAPGLAACCLDGLPLLLSASEDIELLNGEELADRVLSVFRQL